MTETGKKGFDYINNQINKGNADILSIIGELVTKNEKQKAQIERMKNCENCNHNLYRDCQFDYENPNEEISCDKWELA